VKRSMKASKKGLALLMNAMLFGDYIKEARYLEILHFIKLECGLDTKLMIVVPQYACRACRADDRKVITLGDAYNNPFLPYQDCCCISSGGKYPFCRWKYELLYGFET
jgi:hypothetical protein